MLSSSSSITLAHLMPAPFVQQVGRALFEAGILSQFATTLTNRSDASWQKACIAVAKLVKFDLAQQLTRRSITELPLSVVQDFPLPEVLRLLVGKLDRDQRLTDMVFHWGRTAFDQWVARTMLEQCSAIYSYEYTCLESFQAAKQRGIARIYEVPSPDHDFVENLLHDELQRYPELTTPYRNYVHTKQAKRTHYRRQEWQLADVVIVNSQFTKRSYAAAGLDVSKVHVIPLGAPPVQAEIPECKTQDGFRFLWAGTFSIRKGAHYLLQAWKQIQPSHARLDVYGAMGLPSILLQDLPDSTYLLSTVSQSELFKLYQQADVLVFPTLCDGFGMVITEAFAQGLPVITTDRAGASDLVRHGENGLIVPAGNAEALAEAMNWCLTHPQELQSMREAARETAAYWQWSDFRKALVTNLMDGLQAAGYTMSLNQNYAA
jgi:glycosyltransferase involved in cell wall biosynthesis